MDVSEKKNYREKRLLKPAPVAQWRKSLAAVRVACVAPVACRYISNQQSRETVVSNNIK